MAKCSECGEYENLPYQCGRCGQSFCSEHRLPENHDCPSLGEWNDPGGVFDSGFDETVEEGGSGGGVGARVKSTIDRETGTGGIMGAFRGNMTYVFLGLMWVTFAAQWAVILTGGPWQDVFVLSERALRQGYVWTVVTSVFSHSPTVFFHIAGNSIALYFFGPLVERYLGSKRFAAMFLVTGAVAGLSQIGVGVLLGATPGGVLGASGAIMAVMGFLTVVNPDLKVMLLIPPIPLKIRTITLLYAAFSLFGVVSSGSILGGAGGIAHAAHLSGLVLGVVYANVADGQRAVPDQIGSGGGGLGGGRGRL